MRRALSDSRLFLAIAFEALVPIRNKAQFFLGELTELGRRLSSNGPPEKRETSDLYQKLSVP